MSLTFKAFLITTGLCAAFTAMYALIELLRGNVPFAMIHWSAGGKYLTITFSLIIAIGTAVGIASDHVQKRQRR